MVWSGLPPELVWGLIPRFVGVLYLLAFGSLSFQLLGIIGSEGVAPLKGRFDGARRDFPGLRRFFDFPSIFWLSSSDAMIRAVPVLGMLSGALACYGGELGYVGLFVGWLLWLSVEPAGLIFPWDTLLQEVGFLALFLPLSEPLPSLHASAPPLPSVAFMFRWLVLRLMLGFAKVKFVGTSKGDSMYLRGFLIWTPLPTPLAWWAHHAPRWVLKASLYFMFVGEAIAPVLGFFTGAPRVWSFAIMTALMIGIHITGNWGYFNIGFIMLSVCLLDTESSLFELAEEPWRSGFFAWPELAINAAMLLLFLTSLVYFVVMNSWVSRTWVHWNWDDLIWNKRWARAVLGYFRALAPFHLTNGYGVFPPNASPPIRFAPVIEGSLDGKTWKPYGYKYLPTSPTSRLPIVAPHHPRFDQALHYGSIGMHDGSFFSSIIGDGNPYLAYLRSCWLERAPQRILLGDKAAKREILDDPFPNTPPNWVRVSTYTLAPTRPSELKRSGERWRVRRLGTLIRARSKRDWIDAQAIPPPELFHFDFVHFKQRAHALRAMLASHDAGVEPDRAVLVESDLEAEQVTKFWHELVPELAIARGDWTRVHERAAAIAARFLGDELYRLERLLQRFAWILRQRVVPYMARGLQPKIVLNSNFRFELFLHEVIVDGREAYLQMLRAPEQAAARAAQTSDETQLWTLAMMRYDMMIFHICTFRWNEIGRYGHQVGLQGIFEFYPLLSKIVPPDEEFVPIATKHDDGEFTVEGLYAPPWAESLSGTSQSESVRHRLGDAPASVAKEKT